MKSWNEHKADMRRQTQREWIVASSYAVSLIAICFLVA